MRNSHLYSMRNSLLSRNRTIAATHGRVAVVTSRRVGFALFGPLFAPRETRCVHSFASAADIATLLVPVPCGHVRRGGQRRRLYAVWLVVVLVAAAAAAAAAAAIAAALLIPSRYAGATTGQQLLAVPPTPATTSPRSTPTLTPYGRGSAS